MTSKKTTRRVLFSSIMALLLCCSMLVGTTFAWFTDSVTSTENKIQSGTLKVDLELLDKTTDIWNSIKKSKSALFDYENWEPGYMMAKVLKVENEGSLALKWVAKFISANEVTPIAKVIDVYVCPSETELDYPERSLDGYTKVGTLDQFINTLSNTTYGALEAGQAAYLGLALKMQETAGNEYQNMALGAFDIQIFATQHTVEPDSFDNQYDKAAAWNGRVDTDWYNASETEFVLSSADELAGLAKLVNSSTDTFEGKTVKLGANIDLNDISWTPIGSSANGWDSKFNGTFIGTGYTISNLFVTGTKGVGLFGYVGNAAHIEGVKIDGAYVCGNDYVGAVMGTGYLAANCLKNCTVENATIIAMPYLMADGVTYDGGAKAGAVAGYAINGNITGNKASKCSVSAYRDLGGIAGMAAGENRNIEVSGNTVENVTLTYLRALPYADGKENENMRSFVGRYDEAKVEVKDNTESNVVRETVLTYTIDGITYTKDVDTNKETLVKVEESYAKDTVTVPDGVKIIGRYAFAYNDGVEKIVLSNTVTTLDERAFRDTSASEVILNEGLTNISYQAFRNAANITTVEIPSTVTTISKEAFQNSGITTLTIPATVETIEYGGLRDMKYLESVTIHSAAGIPVYAFRACTNLKSVFLTSEDVTFGGGSRGMIFTNKENGDGSAITVYVANEEVKSRLEAADTAATDYGGYTIIVTSVVENADALVEALEAGKNVTLTSDVKINPANMSNAYGKTGISVKNGQTIDGNGHTLDIKGAGGTWDSGINTTGGLIKNLKVTGSFRGIFINHNSTHSERVVLENVIIDGTTYTISCDQGMNQGLTATDSTFNGWTSYAGTLGEAKFEDCSFGKGNGYAFCRPYAPTAFVGCDFAEGYTVDPVAAVTFENCTVSGVALTAENLDTLVTGNIANATVK
ncbi:MAG: hypothetical protein E7440_07340 [Ruminococcaceae bacterium]|nr:hypothetical protein [Oscillospiraceae bacterium]